MKRKLNVAVIGSGARGLWVLGHEFIRRTEDVRVLGFCDPRSRLRENVDWIISDMAEKGTPLDYSILTTSDHRELLAIDGLDFVLLATPNHLHADYAEAVCQAGIGMLIEKPLATNVRDLNRIVAAEQQSGVKVFVGFCMRYNRLFARAKELIVSGTIGRPRLLSFQDYFALGRGYFRSRNRFERFSGGLLVEKACHSFDLIGWLLDSTPVRTSCFGRLSVFTPKEEASETCPGCPLAETCPDYRESRSGGTASSVLPVRRVQEKLLSGRPCLPSRQAKRGRAPLCVYNSEKDVDDTDAVLIDYESGALASYVECFYSPTVERRFSVVGDRGELLASEERGGIEYRRLGEDTWTHLDVEYNAGGHRGADPLMVSAAIDYFRGEVGEEAKGGTASFVLHDRRVREKLLSGRPCLRSTQAKLVGSQAGRLSVLVAMAAQRSAVEGRVVTIEELAADESAGAFGDETPGQESVC